MLNVIKAFLDQFKKKNISTCEQSQTTQQLLNKKILLFNKMSVCKDEQSFLIAFFLFFYL